MPSIVRGIAVSPGQKGRRTFAPRLATSLATLFAVLLFSHLGAWQVQRADQAREAQALRAEGARQPVIDLARVPAGEMPALLWRPVTVAGAWQAPATVLLDNQIEAGRAGYRMYGLLRPTGCACALLVDRGWLAPGPDRARVPGLEALPDPGMPVRGRLIPLPAAGIGVRNDVEVLPDGVLRVQRLDVGALPTGPGIRILPLVLEPDQRAIDGAARQRAESRADRHTAYAVQWFAFALIAAILYLVLNLKRR
ncbi:MAG: SURF1 family protein [Rhodocyclales bacterium]|nr:SURF1 family protein [Rhodocyclales bacterium]